MEIDKKIPESTLRMMRDAQENYKKLLTDFASFVPNLQNIKIPSFLIPPKSETFILPPSMDVISEKNAWTRHGEILNVQSAVLEIQKEILKEQKSTTKLTVWILCLTVLGIMVSLFSILFVG